MKESKQNLRKDQRQRSRRVKKTIGARVKASGARSNENRLASFLEDLPSFAWMKDLEGRYVYANSAVQSIREYCEGLIGKTDAVLWPKEIADAYRVNDEKVIAEGKPLEALEPFLIDGERHFALVSKF